MTPGPSDGTRLPTSLSMCTRILCGLLGVSAVAVGTLAIFVKNNSGGSLALIATGALFLLMGVTGHGVRSFKVGPNEIVMDTLNEARVLRSTGDDEGAEELIENLIAKPLAPPIDPHLPFSFYARNAADSLQYQSITRPLLYESAVWKALTEVIADRAVISPDTRGPHRFDLLLTFDGGPRVGVEIRSGTRIRPAAFAASMQAKISSLEEEFPLQALFVIVNAPPNSEESILVVHLRKRVPIPFLIWTWRPQDGVERMRQGVDLLIKMSQR